MRLTVGRKKERKGSHYVHLSIIIDSMSGITSISSIWNNIKEIDLRPLREEALQLLKIAIVGDQGSGRSRLAAQLRRDPSREDIELQTPVMILDFDDPQLAQTADLIILLVGAGSGDLSRARNLARKWLDSGKPVVAIVDPTPAAPAEGQAGKQIELWGNLPASRLLFGSPDDVNFLLAEFVPAVIELLPNRLLPLGRNFPLFRPAIANRMISETSFSNATYSLSTGIAEIAPVFNIPLNVADMVVLTKAQAFLVYKLGLALGLSIQWQDYVSEFGSVLGGGFLWRQIARSLAGLIPAWGIVPKVAVAYAGTYVVGNVVLQWYQTGRHISRKQMRELYSQAIARGQNVARELASRVPRLGRRRQKAHQLPSGGTSSLPVRTNARETPAEVFLEENPEDSQKCANCGRISAPDAVFCQYCGQKF